MKVLVHGVSAIEGKLSIQGLFDASNKTVTIIHKLYAFG